MSDPIIDFIIDAGFANMDERELVRTFSEKCAADGLPLTTALVIVDTLHPIFEGRAFGWADHLPDGFETEYGSSEAGDAAQNWQRSTFYELEQQGGPELRLRLCDGERRPANMITELIERGRTDYIAFIHRMPKENAIGQMDRVYSHFATNAEDGFREGELARLRQLAAALALAMKAAALARVTRTLAYVYLGHGAAETVLRGRILRGMSERIDAVLWFSDLRGYTALAEEIAPEEVIPFLNDYAAAAIGAIHGAGGEVLKLIGDGVLAIFRAGGRARCSACALDAEAAFRTRAAEVTARRAAAGQPTTTAYVALHVGTVFYGNIGSEERLDFTVVGPAVNQVSRIATMCRSVDRDLLVSEDFRATLEPEARARLVSTGRFALRGVALAQDLYTLDPSLT